MKTINTGHEILLLTNSSLAKSALSSSNSKGDSYGEDKLKEACWNGILAEWLPDSVIKNDKEGPMFLWKIDQGNTFLCIEMSMSPGGKDFYFSLDPYMFLPSLNIN